jgi:tungstate transport system ATP-binding protein
MNHSAVYQLREVHKNHGLAFALQIADLHIQRGEVFALLGPTGAGKSTLLRLLAGLEPPGSGEIRFESQGFLADSLSTSSRRRITLVHQRPLLLTGTVRLNVEYGLRLRGAREVFSKTEAMLDRLGLRELASQSAQTLSGGQVQLVALARSLVIEPEVLLLDEPTANLDPASVSLVEETIRDVQRERSMTIVWATHNLFQARRMATRTALILNGRLVEVAATDQFFGSPADPRTADFVQGRMVY